MKIKSFSALIGLTAVLSGALATILYFSGMVTNFYWGLYLPLDLAAGLLRTLSLHSALGNGVAWILYISLCLGPALPVAVRRFKNPREKAGKKETFTEVLLMALSVYLFFTLYSFINPGALSWILPEMSGGEWAEGLPWIKGLLASVGYSLVLSYGVLKLAGKVSGGDLYQRTKGLLMGCTAVYVAFVCFALPLELFQQLTSGATAFSIPVLLNYFLKLLPLACMVGIMEAAVQLVGGLQKDKYGPGAVHMARLMAERSRRTVIAAVCCSLTRQGIQLAFWTELQQADILLDIPFLPLILAFVGLLLAEYLQDSAELYEENQMIV